MVGRQLLITMAIGCFIIYYGVLIIGIGMKGKLEIVRALPKSMLYLTIPVGGFFIVYFALMHIWPRGPDAVRAGYDLPQTPQCLRAAGTAGASQTQ